MSRAKRCFCLAIVCSLWLHPENCLSQGRLTLDEVSITLEKNAITEHEPVILDVRIQSPLSSSLDFDPGYNWENIKIKVIDPDGRVWHRPSQESREGMRFSNAVHVDAGATATFSLVASDWFSFDKHGIYRIEVGLRPASSSVNSDLSLQVLPRDEVALKAACSALLDRVNNSQSFSASLVAARALADVNDSAAVPYLLAAVKRREFASTMINALGRLNSQDAINALIQASKSDDAETSSRARVALSTLQRAKERQ